MTRGSQRGTGVKSSLLVLDYVTRLCTLKQAHSPSKHETR